MSLEEGKVLSNCRVSMTLEETLGVKLQDPSLGTTDATPVNLKLHAGRVCYYQLIQLSVGVDEHLLLLAAYSTLQ